MFLFLFHELFCFGLNWTGPMNQRSLDFGRKVFGFKKVISLVISVIYAFL